ncbi:actin filament-associated protein [Acrasis kona]|uniref:Actin filament-associated protein n=1 Tax=Acrasis kona TaxID=1008807 RepID=A0AAW2ZP48_9EUKA
MDRHEILELKSTNLSLNEVLMLEANKLTQQYEELKQHLVLMKSKEAELIKKNHLQNRTVENLLLRIKDLENNVVENARSIRKEKNDKIQLLEIQLEQKEATIETLELQVEKLSQQLKEAIVQKDILVAEKNVDENRMKTAQDVFRNMDITPIYHEVVDLFTQLYPDEDNIVQFMVKNRTLPPKPQSRPDTQLHLPQINQRPEESASSSTSTTARANENQKLPEPVIETASIGIQVDLMPKDPHSIPKPSFISKMNQEAYLRTLPQNIVDMRTSLEERTNQPPVNAARSKRSFSVLDNYK